jgi:subtilisin family serine protease
VINVSLVGPRNRIIEALVAQLVARGFIIVAAVGNDGPAAAPLYPASYPGVVGVTGVDARGRALPEAARGPQVDFAAAGVVPPRTRGTSYAAPIVAGLMARRIERPEPGRARSAVDALRAEARDLGERGRDNVYGDGLLEISPGTVATR